jgi:phospholipase/carboxylesterase
MKTKELSLQHLIRPNTDKSTKPPVLFMFHGYGSDEADLFSFASELSEQLFIISARAPFTVQPFGYCWYTINFGASFGKWSDVEQACTSRELILNFIDEAVSAYELDPEQVNLLGFSQGSVLSYAVALSYPEKIKNVVALSGYIDENTLVKGYAKKDHSHLNVYASHGQVDQVIPTAWAQQIPGFLKTIDVDVEYEEFPVGHGVSPQNFFSFKRWLENLI